MRYYWVSTFTVLFMLAVLDHIVNATLYNYGLEFDWGWFTAYGVCFGLIFLFLGIRSATMYYHSTEHPYWMKALALIVTDVSLWVGGYLDFLWFLIDGTIPPSSQAWWWMPQSRIIEGYNIDWHILWVLGWTLLLGFMWVYVMYKERIFKASA